MEWLFRNRNAVLLFKENKNIFFSVKLVHMKLHGIEIAKLLKVYTSYGFIALFHVNMFLKKHR